MKNKYLQVKINTCRWGNNWLILKRRRTFLREPDLTNLFTWNLGLKTYFYRICEAIFKCCSCELLNMHFMGITSCSPMLLDSFYFDIVCSPCKYKVCLSTLLFLHTVQFILFSSWYTSHYLLVVHCVWNFHSRLFASYWFFLQFYSYLFLSISLIWPHYMQQL